MNALYVVEADGDIEIHPLHRPAPDDSRLLASDLSEREAEIVMESSRGSNDLSSRVYRALASEMSRDPKNLEPSLAALFARIANVVGTNDPEENLARLSRAIRGAEESLHRDRHRFIS